MKLFKVRYISNFPDPSFYMKISVGFWSQQHYHCSGEDTGNAAYRRLKTWWLHI